MKKARKQSGKFGKPVAATLDVLSPKAQEMLSRMRTDENTDWARSGPDLIAVRLWEEDGWGQIVLAQIFHEEDFGTPPW